MAFGKLYCIGLDFVRACKCEFSRIASEATIACKVYDECEHRTGIHLSAQTFTAALDWIVLCSARILVSWGFGPALAVCSGSCALLIALWSHQAAEETTASVQCAHHARRYSHTCAGHDMIVPSAHLAHEPEHEHHVSTSRSSMAT